MVTALLFFYIFAVSRFIISSLTITHILMNFRLFLSRKLTAIVVLLTFALNTHAQTKASFRVEGDIDKFYPVLFTDCEWFNNKATELEIGRSDVHVDGEWRGSLMSKFRYHVTNWGNGANFIDAEINEGNTADSPNEFIAGWGDPTGGNALNGIVIWLRGNTTYNYSCTCTMTPYIYDGVQNALPMAVPDDAPLTYKTAIDPYVQSNGVSSGRNMTFNGAGTNVFMGSMAIGTYNASGYKLAVNGNAIFGKVTVKNPANWPDYVFASDYQLPSLHELDKFIRQHKHLPGTPTATEISDNGQDIAALQVIQQQKIEELTLYLIKLNKELEDQREKIKVLEERLKK